MTIDIGNLALSEILHKSAEEVLLSMLNLEITCTESRAELRSEPPFDGILSVVGLTGPWTGSGYIRCSGKTACLLASRFLMMDTATAVDDDVLDAVGEITNMIIGTAKNSLEEHLGLIQMSIPTVVYGKNISTRNLKTDVCVPVVCAFEGGEILLSICLTHER